MPGGNDLRLRDINLISDVPCTTGTEERLRTRDSRHDKVLVAAYAAVFGVLLCSCISAVILYFALGVNMDILMGKPDCSLKEIQTSFEPPILRPEVPEATETPVTELPTFHHAAIPLADTRLPEALEPLAYAVELDVRHVPVTGRLKVDFRVLQATDRVVLHADARVNVSFAPLAEVRCRQTDGTKTRARWPLTHHSTHHNHSAQQVRFALHQPLHVGLICSLPLEFATNVSLDLRGFSRFRLRSDDKKQIESFFTAFADPLNARQMFPCFDDSRWRVSLAVNVTHAARDRLLGVSVREMHSLPSGALVSVLAFDAPVAVDALTFVLGPFEELNVTEFAFGNLSSFAISSDADLTEVTLEAFGHFANWLGWTPSLNEFGVVAVPGLFAESLVLSNVVLVDVGVLEDADVEEAVYRAVAQFWTQNLEPTDHFAHALLSGLALTLCQTRFAPASTELRLKRGRLLFDALLRDAAIDSLVPAAGPETVWQAEYESRHLVVKASTLFASIQKLMGAEAFRSGVGVVLRSLQGQRVSAEAFLAALDKHTPSGVEGPGGIPLELGPVFLPALRRAGFPLLVVHWQTSSTASLVVHNFLTTPVVSYDVPVFYSFLHDPTERVLWISESHPASLEMPSMLLVDTELCGFYATNRTIVSSFDEVFEAVNAHRPEHFARTLVDFGVSVTMDLYTHAMASKYSYRGLELVPPHFVPLAVHVWGRFERLFSVSLPDLGHVYTIVRRNVLEGRVNRSDNEEVLKAAVACSPPPHKVMSVEEAYTVLAFCTEYFCSQIDLSPTDFLRSIFADLLVVPTRSTPTPNLERVLRCIRQEQVYNLLDWFFKERAVTEMELHHVLTTLAPSHHLAPMLGSYVSENADLVFERIAGTRFLSDRIYPLLLPTQATQFSLTQFRNRKPQFYGDPALDALDDLQRFEAEWMHSASPSIARYDEQRVVSLCTNLWIVDCASLTRLNPDDL